MPVCKHNMEVTADMKKQNFVHNDQVKPSLLGGGGHFCCFFIHWALYSWQKSLMISYTKLPYCFEPNLTIFILVVCGISTWAELPTKVQYIWIHNHKLHIHITLNLLISTIDRSPSNARNANVYSTETFIWQRWSPSLSIWLHVSTLNESWKQSCVIFVCKHLVSYQWDPN